MRSHRAGVVSTAFVHLHPIKMWQIVGCELIDDLVEPSEREAIIRFELRRSHQGGIELRGMGPGS